MLFAGFANTVAYLERASLTLYDKSRLIARLELPPEMVQSLEVLDPEGLNKLILAFGQQQNLSGRRIIVALHESLVFQRVIPHTAPTDDQAAVEDLQNKLPFSSENKSYVTFDQGTQLTFYGTNRALYDVVATGLEQAGGKVMAVVAAPAYGLVETYDQVKPGNLRSMMRNQWLAEKLSFRPAH